MLVVFEKNGSFRVVGTASDEMGLTSMQGEPLAQNNPPEFVENVDLEKAGNSGGPSADA
ncbi:hypothetical protein [Paraburkholderia sp. BR14374]|uniref:hypothetical protein n=1 Tax=Paraburkholderia sp. BR14374 TaxID=3237007 RepID=UPI0034CF98E1